MLDQETIDEKKAEGCQLIRLIVDDNPVLVFLNMDWLKSKLMPTSHAEFYSDYVSETGYLSHFFHFTPDVKDSQEVNDAWIYDYLVAIAEHQHKELAVKKPITEQV